MQIKEDGRNPCVPASQLALYTLDLTEPSSQNWNANEEEIKALELVPEAEVDKISDLTVVSQ